MGLFDVFKGKKENVEEDTKAGKENKNEGRFSEECAACGGTATDKKWMGQYWHKKCLRKIRKSTKGMI